MKSKVKKLLAGVVAAVLLGLGASSAQAGFDIREIRSTSAGVDTVQLFAYNDGAGGSGTKLSAIELTVQALAVASAVPAGPSSGPYTSISTPGVGGSMLTNGLNVALLYDEFTGDPIGVDVPGFTSITKSYLRAGTTANWTAVLSSTDAVWTDEKVDFMSHTGYATDISLQPVANTGNGTRFAVLRVPAGSAIRVQGKLGSEALLPDNVNYYSQVIDTNDAAIPEPATLGLLSLGALGLMARRRRA